MIRFRIWPWLMLAACATSPHAAGPAEKALGRKPVVVAPGPAAPQTAPKGGGVPAPKQPAPKVAPKGLRYTYGAKFEPPEGRILDGMGQWPKYNEEFLEMIGDDPKLQPATQLMYIIIGDWRTRKWETRFANYQTDVLMALKAGRTPHIGMQVYGMNEQSELYGIDSEIAAGSNAAYDDRLRQLARFLAGLGRPIFMRIGGEFSGDWNPYHGYSYPKAFRRIHEIFDQEGAHNVAYVWCYEPSAPDDFDQVDEQGALWYPGDDVVDWFGIDVFPVCDFDHDAAKAQRKASANHTDRFLAMARAHHKPVHVSEVSANDVAVTPDKSDGRRDWDQWFAPFFKWLGDHPEIKGIAYVNCDWTKVHPYNERGWLDARLNVNEIIRDNWLREIRKPAWVHADEMYLLKDWAASFDADKDYSDFQPPKPAGR